MKDLLTSLIESAKKNDTVRINPEQAFLILEDYHFENQRSVSPYRVNEIVYQLKNNEFLPYHDLKVAELDGKKYLTDGGHRLAACIKADMDIEVGMILKRFNNRDDLNSWYATIDVGRQRNIIDGIMAWGFRNDYKLTATEAQGIVGASKLLSVSFNYYKARFKGRRGCSLQDIKKFVEMNIRDYAEYIQMVREYASDKKTARRLVNKQFLAFSAITKSSFNWKLFWEGLASDSGLERGDPVKLLIDKIKENSGTMATKQQMVMHNMFARAWNAYVDNRELTVFQNVTGDKLLPIKGTDFGHIYDYEEIE